MKSLGLRAASVHYRGCRLKCVQRDREAPGSPWQLGVAVREWWGLWRNGRPQNLPVLPLLPSVVTQPHQRGLPDSLILQGAPNGSLMSIHVCQATRTVSADEPASSGLLSWWLIRHGDCMVTYWASLRS